METLGVPLPPYYKVYITKHSVGVLVGGYFEKSILMLKQVLDLVDESKRRGKVRLEIAINALLR